MEHAEYRERFAGIETALAAEAARCTTLIKELLDRLSSTETDLCQTRLDLDNECEARRRLQQEVQSHREREGRRPFVAVLIDADGDGYVFNERFLVQGEKGGEDAADALLAALQTYQRDEMGTAAAGVDFVVRAFANVGGLGMALERDGRLKDASQLRAFAAGFNRRHVFFDFVDVGSGKERADFKVQENVKFFVENFQCKHLVVACGHDTGYAPFLGQLVGDKEVRDRITLLEGSPFPPVIRDLGFKQTRFDSVFTKVMKSDSQSAANNAMSNAAKSAWGQDLPSGVTTAKSGSNDKQPSRQSPPTRPAAALPTKPVLLTVKSQRYYNSNAHTHRLGPVVFDKDGRRVDRPLSVSQAVADKLRKLGLCYFLFLRGECIVSTCKGIHKHEPLSDEEFDALWWQARQWRCYKNQRADSNPSYECTDPLCVYGHKNGNK